MSTDLSSPGEQAAGAVPLPESLVTTSSRRPPPTPKAIFLSTAHLAAAAAPPRMKITVEVSPELDAIIDNMAEGLEETKGTTILRALALLKTALEARSNGERLVIVNDDENTERALEF